MLRFVSKAWLRWMRVVGKARCGAVCRCGSEWLGMSDIACEGTIENETARLC